MSASAAGSLERAAPTAHPFDFADTAAIVRRAMDAEAVVICEPGLGDSGVAILGRSAVADDQVPDVFDLAAAALRVVDVSAEGDAQPVVRSDCGEGVVLSTAMVVNERVAGSIHAFHRLPPDGAGHERLLASLARQTAFAVEHSRMQHRSAALDAEFAILSQLDEVALSVAGMAELVTRLTDILAPLVQAELVGVAVLNEDREVLQMLPGSYGASPEVAASCQISTHDPRSSSARVLLMRQPWMTEHAGRERGSLQEFVAAFGLKRVMTIPLVVAGRGIGILNLANKPTAFTAEDVARIQLFAPRVASTVENVRLLLQIRRREELEAILSDLAVAIVSGASLLPQVTSALGRYAEVIGAGLVALSAPGQEPIIIRRATPDPELESRFFKDAGEVGRSARSEVATPQAAGDPGWAALHVPVLVSKQRAAALSVLREGGGAFGSDEIAALSRFADLAALGYTTERYQRERAKIARLTERHRIADDLHDTVAQMLFSAQLALESTLERGDPTADGRAEILQATNLIVRGQAAIRELIGELSEPQRADLATRLTVLADELESEHGLAVNLDVSVPAAGAAKALRKAMADLFVRAMTESVMNAAKHAQGATRVNVSLTVSAGQRLLMRVTDNGQPSSSSLPRRSYGLASLRNAFRLHGGIVRLGSDAGGGRTLTASIPL